MPYIGSIGNIKQGTKVIFKQTRQNGNYDNIIKNKNGTKTGEVMFIYHDAETNDKNKQYVYTVRVSINGDNYFGLLLDEDIISYDNISNNIPDYNSNELKG